MSNKLFIFLTLLLLGCTSPKLEPVDWGHDACEHCKMIISDKRFGAELLTQKGKVFKFDSLECMTEFLSSHSEKIGTGYSTFVVDSFSAGKLIPLEQAAFFEDTTLRSPMGKGFLAGKSEDELSKAVGSEKKIKFMNWHDVAKQIQK